jgi:hypothetical protein
MKKYLIIFLLVILTASITSCSDDRQLSYQELVEEHEEKESTDNFFMFLIGLVTVIVIYRNTKSKR